MELEFDYTTQGLAAVALVAAGVIKGTTGIGYVSCALPLLVATIGLKPAMAVVLAPAMATNIVVALTAGHLREAMKCFWPLYLAMVPGIAAGVTMLAYVDQRIAVVTLGTSMLLYASFSLAKPSLRIPLRWQSALKVPTGLLNGFVTGLTGSQVMPLIPYVLGLNLAPALTVQSINLAVILGTVVVGIGLAANGLLTPSLIGASCAAVLPAAAGAMIGSWLRSFLPAEGFRTIALAVLAIMGASMILRT